MRARCAGPSPPTRQQRCGCTAVTRRRIPALPGDFRVSLPGLPARSWPKADAACPAKTRTQPWGLHSRAGGSPLTRRRQAARSGGGVERRPELPGARPAVGEAEPSCGSRLLPCHDVGVMACSARLARPRSNLESHSFRLRQLRFDLEPLLAGVG